MAAIHPVVPALRRGRSPSQDNRPRDESRPARESNISARLARDNQEPARPKHDNNVSARLVRDNHESARPQRDNHESARPQRDNYESARPQRDNHESARPQRDNHESARSQRDNHESARPKQDNGVSARLARDRVNESARPQRDNESSRPQRENYQAGFDKTHNKNADRGRNFTPRAGELRRPKLNNNSPQGSPTDAQEKPNRNWESGKAQAGAPADQVPVKPEVKHYEPKKEPESKRDGTEPEQLVNVANVTPLKKMIPMNCVIDTLSVGDNFLLSVDAKASDCRVDTGGYVCLSMHARVENDYTALCENFSADCDKEPALKPSVGEAFALYNREEKAWYRARLLAPTVAALIDSSKVVAVSADDKCHRLPEEYRTTPEFSCVLHCDAATLEQSLLATITSKSPTIRVKLVDSDTRAPICDGTVARWLPKVDYPAPQPKPVAYVNGDTNNNPSFPVVSRPDIKNNSRVYLVECTTLGAAFVRPCDMDQLRAFDSILQETTLYALKAKPLTEPPVRGTVVISKYLDGNCYRALVRRTNKERNRYQLEYLEFGNIHVNQLENLYHCPRELGIQARPVVTAVFKIGPEDVTFTPAAIEYIDSLKDDSELLLTTESGDTKVPSGSSVNLIVMKSKYNLGTRLQQMCKPEWKKMEEAGGDVVEAEKIMFSELECVKLPPGECELDILDLESITSGIVCGCPADLPHAKYVYTTLTEKMGEYCNSALGREPYLPRDEELCIAQMPPYEQWFRAVKISQNKIGGSTACVMYVDYGTVVRDLPVSLLRKMLPEFVRGLPALAVSITIEDFPTSLSSVQLEAAIRYMKVDDEGRGRLPVTRTVYNETDMCYTVSAPGLLDALRQA